MGKNSPGTQAEGGGEKGPRRVGDKLHYLTGFPMPGLSLKFDEYSPQPRKKKIRAFESPLQRMSCSPVILPFFWLFELQILDSKT